MTIVVMTLWSRFAYLEFQQIKESFFLYMSDVWNVFDLSSLILNAVFIFMLDIVELSDSLIFDPITIRTVGSLCTWFLWIKVFYWMRLF